MERNIRRPFTKLINTLPAFFLVALLTGQSYGQDVVINEYMTANRQAIADEDGKFPDWLELYNNSFDPVSMNGWTISDHPADSSRWEIPNLTLQAFQHLILFASGKDKGQIAPYNETVIRPGDSCRYYIPTSEPDVGWTWPDTDDSGWSRGKLGIGYGDGDDSTIVPAAISVYVRIDFTVESLADLRYAILHVDYDDGFVAYVNGAEVARANVEGLPPPFDTTAGDEREAVIFQGGQPEMYFIGNIVDFVREGRNVLSIQLHNADPASDDLSLIPFLTLGLDSAPSNPRGVPDLIAGFLLQMHTDFKLGANNDTLILRQADGTTVDQVVIEDMPADMSRGRAPDGSAVWRIFETPTPGVQNASTGGTIVTPKPSISPQAGFYGSSVTVTLSDDSLQAHIFYTLDGSIPNDSSLLYTRPFRLDTSCVVRATARIPGELIGGERVSSFIIGPAHTLPVVSLSTDPANLWDPETGIYVLGPSYDPDPPHRGANFWQDWERPVHVEFFEPDGSKGFEVNAGLKIHGGWTRSFPQKSLRIMARSKYGDGNINYKIFPDRDIDKFESIILRNGGSDWDHTLFRDGFLTGLMEDEYPDISAYRPAIVYINGAYFGIQNLREAMNEHYVASHYNVNSSDVDVLEIWGALMNGDWSAYTELLNFINSTDLSVPANYQTAERMIDIPQFIKYCATNIYVANGDWPGNNNRFFRIRKPGEKWHWWLLDLDFGFGLHGENAWEVNSLADALAPDGPPWPNPPYATIYLRKLCQSPVFRTKFINTFADLMNFRFQPDNVLRQFNEKKRVLDPEISRELLRWGRTMADWNEKLADIPEFAQNRSTFMRQFIEGQFGLPGHATIGLNCNPPAGGNVLINEREISPTGWSGVYFRTVPLTIEAIPQPGYRFVGWTGGSSSTNPKLTLLLDAGRSITALFALAPGIVGLPVINEINYNSADSFDVGDWVEIYAYDGEVDLSDWSLSDEDTSHHFFFPMGTVIPDRGTLIVAEDTAKFDSLFPGKTGVIGNLGFGFGRGGDQVKIIGPRGDVIDLVEYDDVPPWPVEADGLGATLELRDPTLPNDDPASWRASLLEHGSPQESNQYNPPGEFAMLWPAKGSRVAIDSVEVGWSQSFDIDPQDTVRYLVEWSFYSDFSISKSAVTLDTTYIIAENPGSSDSLLSRIVGLPNRSEVFWRVSSFDKLNFSAVGSPGDSVWSFRVEIIYIPDEFALRPPFPNPFNGSATITIDVSTAGEVDFGVYDLQGRAVYHINRLMQPGSYRILFDPSISLPSGIYIARARQGELTKIAKLGLVR